MSLPSSEFEEAPLDDLGFEEAEYGQDPSGKASDKKPLESSPPRYRKQGFSIYTVMLMLAFAFLVASIILLFQEVGRFG